MPNTAEATSHHSSRQFSILLPFRAIQNHSFHYETPCMYVCKYSSAFFATSKAILCRICFLFTQTFFSASRPSVILAYRQLFNMYIELQDKTKQAKNTYKWFNLNMLGSHSQFSIQNVDFNQNHLNALLRCQYYAVRTSRYFCPNQNHFIKE